MPIADFSLKDKSAIITGGSRGIGEAIAKGFAEQGATLILCSRKQEGVDAVANEINAAGGKAIGIACHTGQHAAIAALFFLLGLVSFTQGGALTVSFLLSEFIVINLILAFFNLIPIPPLDGSKILFAILPGELVYRLRPLEQYGFLILMALVFFGRGIMSTLIGTPVSAMLQLLIG